ncbi:hypothetical protein ONR57_12820 [Hoyosella sp. YIM 151337]|uniref:hypothetical protein n=1 Tax=Hoyosella sp. YIM 151337 TaxID=2992742 RepID=UPI0022355818|nr:hypothetical protein [Hoyosella sp. YIM 151337]MCW4354184.1 hypothetical protein [Hoyosella sp. YIM 151337]
MSSMQKKAGKTTSRSEADQVEVRELDKAARARGEDLTGADGLLNGFRPDFCIAAGLLTPKTGTSN